MGRRYETVSFLSDFGTTDGFVGQVKSVVRDLAPHVVVVDLTHDVRPFDVRGGSLALARSVAYLPEGVVLAVVDPGVGTERSAIAIEVAGGAGVFVGPDNGLLAPAVAMAGGAERSVRLDEVEFQLAPVGATSAGRDVFAPVAAHLCNGVDLLELGEPVEAELLMPGVVPLPRDESDALVCEVLWADRFGNCQLNVGPGDLTERWPITVGDRLQVEVTTALGERRSRSVRLVVTFAHLGTGEVGVVEDGYGMLALCLDRASAADELGLTEGDQVVLAQHAPDVSMSDTLGPTSGMVVTPVQMRPSG